MQINQNKIAYEAILIAKDRNSFPPRDLGNFAIFKRKIIKEIGG
jgi:hypothetical protein